MKVFTTFFLAFWLTSSVIAQTERDNDEPRPDKAEVDCYRLTAVPCEDIVPSPRSCGFVARRERRHANPGGIIVSVYSYECQSKYIYDPFDSTTDMPELMNLNATTIGFVKILRRLSMTMMESQQFNACMMA